MKETWKDIDGFIGLYQISNFGRVRSLDRYIRSNNGQRLIKGMNKKHFINGSGYAQCKLGKDGVVFQPYIHKLVAEHFIENKLGLLEVNHIDHVKLNNHVSNLEWCTRKENMVKYHEFHGTIKLTKTLCSCGEDMYIDAVMCITCRRIESRTVERPSKEELLELIKNTSFTQIGKMYGVSDNAIRKWCRMYGLPHRKADIKMLYIEYSN